jgi:hypothetical protein
VEDFLRQNEIGVLIENGGMRHGITIRNAGLAEFWFDSRNST